MRRIVVSEFVSLDGVVEDPVWTFRFGSEERERFKLDELAASDALLLGRVTYEGFAEAWPSVDDEEGFTDMMNGYPKHVVSGTLREPLEWNNSTVIKGRRSSWRSFGRPTRRTHPHPLPRPPLSMRGARPPPWRGIPPTATADRTPDRHPPNPDTPN
jgi:dihydrofolate reductase